MVTERLLVLTSAAFLLCCSGGFEPPAPAATDNAPSAARSPRSSTTVAPTATTLLPGEGLLEVSSGKSATSFLGSLHAVVTDAAGDVLGGADEDAAPDSNGDRGLSLALPAGEAYTVSLTAMTSDSKPTACRASVGSLRIDAGSTARAQIFSWDCGGVSGYVPPQLQTDCYWLADWSFVTRTSAGVGQLIDVSAAGHDLDGNLPKFSWSTPSPKLGSFEDPAAAKTAFRCAAAGENLSLTVALSDDTCAQQVTQTVSCR